MNGITSHTHCFSRFQSLIRQAGLLFIMGVVLLLSACKEKDSFFRMRGAVLTVGDLKTLDRPRPAHENGINTIGTHGSPSEIAAFVGSIAHQFPNKKADVKPQRKELRLGKRIADGEISIDGSPNERAWRTSIRISPFSNPWSEVCPKTSLSMLHDSRNVYFLYEVEDTDIVCIPNIDNELDVAKGDRVELFFSKDSLMKEYYCFEVNPEGRTLAYSCRHYRKYDYGWDAPAGYFAAGTRVVPHLLKRGYTVEIAVPKTFLSGLMQDNSLYFGAYRAEYSNSNGTVVENWQTWQAPPTAEPDFHVPESLGKLYLSD